MAIWASCPAKGSLRAHSETAYHETQPGPLSLGSGAQRAVLTATNLTLYNSA